MAADDKPAKGKKKEEKGTRLSYRYRIYPTDEQKHQIALTIGCTRYVFNHYLKERKDAYERTQEKVRRPKPMLDEAGNEVVDERGRSVYERDEDTGKVVYHMVPNLPPEGTYDPSAKAMGYYDTSKDLTRLKRETVDEDGHAWLKDADSIALGYALRNLDAAYSNFFKSLKKDKQKKGSQVGYPRFKSRRNEVQTYKTAHVKMVGVNPETNEQVVVDKVPSPIPADWKYRDVTWTGLVLPKLGFVKTKIHRMPEGVFVACSVTQSCSGRYYVALNVKEAEVTKAKPAEGKVGVTYGVSHWAVTSDGAVYDLPERLERLERRLARAQVDLARKTPGSANYRKAKRRVARVNERIANVRAAAVHGLTRELVDSYGTIASRKMASKEMQQHKSDATRDLPAKVKRKLNHDVSNGSYFEINRQLEYKSAWAGRAFVAVPEDAPTAQVCTKCGYENEDLAADLKPKWTCPKCGFAHDRKANGAQNVLDAGLDILAEQESAFVTKAKTRRTAERKKKAAADKAQAKAAKAAEPAA